MLRREESLAAGSPFITASFAPSDRRSSELSCVFNLGCVLRNECRHREHAHIDRLCAAPGDERDVRNADDTEDDPKVLRCNAPLADGDHSP